MDNNEVSTSPTKLTSGWKIKIKSNASSTQHHIPALPIVESDSAFNRRIDQWSKTPNFISMLNHLQKDVQKDIDRRRQQQQQQRVDQLDKTTRTDLKKENNNNNNISATSTSTANDIQHNGQKINNNNNNINPFVFETPSILSKNEYEAWFYSKNDSIHHPHQWLKLASLFHIHPKTAYQRSLLQSNCLNAAQKDRQVTKEINERQLENYLDLRQAQNRKYAQDAVNEGIKLYEQQKNKEALDFYKRALDMDPQYADGWYHVAQSLLQEKRTNDAILQLKRALKIEPNHEKAKTLLCTLENTTTYRDDKKVESGQQRINNMDSTTKKSKIDITDTNEILMDESSDEEESKNGSKRRHRHSEKHKKKRKYKHRSISPRSSSSKRKRYSSKDNKDEVMNDNQHSDHNNISSDNGKLATAKDNNNSDDHHHRHRSSSGSRNKHRHSYHDTKHKTYSSSSSKHKHDDHDHDKHHRHHRTSRHETSSSSREKSKERSSKHYSSRHSHGYHRRH